MNYIDVKTGFDNSKTDFILNCLNKIGYSRIKRKSGIWNAYETIDMQYVLDKLREEDVSIEEKQEVLVDNETSEETGIL